MIIDTYTLVCCIILVAICIISVFMNPFMRRIHKKQEEGVMPENEEKPISVLVLANDNAEALDAHLPQLLSQKYTADYEVIVVMKHGDASLIGAALPADEIQIWTDIDGMHNNDPRVVDKTDAIHQLNFEEAAELAYFGAKILHPTCVQPAKYAGVPVRLKNTLDPHAEGTIIDNVLIKGKIKAVAAKDNITAIKIKSSRMLFATGFLRKIFEIFETYQTPIDMITTSEVGVSMSIDSSAHLNEIVDELKKYGTVTVDTDMCIVCVVGDLDWSNLGFETLVLDAMKEIPIRMISYGGSNYNISFLIKEADKKRALQKLSETLFNKKEN